MLDLTLTINGQAITTHDTFDVINPATEEVLAKCPAATEEHVEMAVQSAQSAFAHWRELSEPARGAYLVKAADAIEPHVEEIAKLLSQEQGKILAKAIGEVESCVARLRSSSELRLPVEIAFEDDDKRIELHHLPLGVVAVITPWNYPVSIAISRMCSAIMAGNTCVIKPSPYTPLSILLAGEIMRDIFPAGVVNVIAGTDEIGAQLTQHPLVKKISFTGSVPTGKAIAGVAADDLKRVTLELGGNDPAIVLEDADVDKIAEPIFWGAFGNSGQVCIAIKRLYIHENVYQPLLTKLKELAEKLKLGNGLDETSQLGPLNNKMQLDIVSSLVEDAKANGATIVTGGERLPCPGYFYKPTLVSDIQEGVRLVDEEQFGPALPVMKFTDVDDVIRRANDTEMGLGASVWSNDVERATEIAKQLEAGTAWVNTVCDMDSRAPFGGMKQSGIGRVLGRWGLAELTELQTVYINKV